MCIYGLAVKYLLFVSTMQIFYKYYCSCQRIESDIMELKCVSKGLHPLSLAYDTMNIKIPF